MKLLLENWHKFLNEASNLSEQQQPVIHFMDWLIDKTNRVHNEPGQGSIFAIPTEQVVEKVKEVAGSVTNVSEIANGSGALSVKVPGIGYDLVAKVVGGKPVDQKGMPIEGQMTTISKEEGRDAVQVEAIETNRPLSDFETDDLTIIIRPMKTKDGEIIPNEYIILSAFPGTTGADLRASEWGGKYVVVLPRGQNEEMIEEESDILSNIFKLCPAGTKCPPEFKKTKWWKGR